jgi:hypothetical protein
MLEIPSNVLAVAIRAVSAQMTACEALLESNPGELQATEAGDYWAELNFAFGVLADAYASIRVEGIDPSLDALVGATARRET